MSAVSSLSALESDVVAQVNRLLAEHPPGKASRVEFLGAQFDAGLAWVHFPLGHGGLDYPIQLQEVVRRLLEGSGAPNGYAMNTTGYGQGAATIVINGTEDQRRRYLRPLFTCEEIWCQLFSEPGSGSDLAGLSTRAVPRRRGVGGHRSEGVDDPRASRPPRLAPGAHRPGG